MPDKHIHGNDVENGCGITCILQYSVSNYVSTIVEERNNIVKILLEYVSFRGVSAPVGQCFAAQRVPFPPPLVTGKCTMPLGPCPIMLFHNVTCLNKLEKPLWLQSEELALKRNY